MVDLKKKVKGYKPDSRTMARDEMYEETNTWEINKLARFPLQIQFYGSVFLCWY